MSNAVDNRVVQLEMQNSSFERNAKQSIRTLSSLDEALAFKNGDKGFENIEKAAAKCNFAPLLSAADSVIGKFSAIEVAGITALSNITNRAVNAGIAMAKSMSIDQITTGFSKYEQKTANVQTLINSTGKSIKEVNGYLDRLMWFSDETSYSFTDMTQALATMVSSGGDVDKIVPMIEGMANATAFAGKGAAEFNRVIYNLNQSYSQGFLGYMDWKSVMQAGASSKQLVEALIRAGEEAGTIKKGQVTIDNFTDTLSKKWATREVMEKGFGYFDEMTQKAYEMIGTLDEQGNVIDTASRAYEILSEQYDGVSLNAAKAAQEAKSFAEAIDSTKDAVSSGWMRTFEIIFGDYEQAKTLWTDVAYGLWDIFAGGFGERNNLLEDVFQSSPVEKFSQKVEEAGVSFDDFKSKMKEAYEADHANSAAFGDFDALTADAKTFNDILSQSWVNSSLLERTLGKLPKSMKETSKGAGKAKGDIRALLKEVNSGKYGYGIQEQQKQLIAAGIDGSYLGTNWLNLLYNAAAHDNEELVNSMNSTIFGVEEVNNVLEDQTDIWDELAAQAKEFDNSYYSQNSGRTIMLDGLKNVLGAVGDRLGVIKDAWDRAFPKMTAERLKNMIIAFHSFTESLKMSADEGERIGAIADRVFGLLSKIRDVLGAVGKFAISVVKLGGRFGSWVLELKPVQDLLGKIKDFFGESYDGALNGLDSFISKITDLTAVIDSLDEKDFEKFIGFFRNIGDELKGFSPNIQSYGSKIKETIGGLFSNVKEGLAGGNGFKLLAGGAFAGIIVAIISKIKRTLEVSGLKEIADKIAGFLDPIGAAFDSFTSKMNSESLRNIAISIGIFATALLVLSAIDGDKIVNALVGIAGAAAILYFVVKKLSDLSSFSLDSIGFGEGIKGFISSLTGNAAQLNKMSSIGSLVKDIAKSILLLAISMRLLSTMDLGQSLIALGSIYAMSLIMTKMAKSMENVSIKGMGSLIAIALSIIVLAGAMKILSGIEIFDAIKGLAVIGVLLLELQYFMNQVSSINPGNIAVMAISMIAIAGAFIILTGVIALLGLMPVASLAKGIVSMGIILTMFSIFANSIESINVGSLLAATASIMLISGALVLIAAALAVFSLVQDKGNSVLGLAVMIVSIATALGLLSNFGGGAGNLLAAAAAILVVSVAMNALAISLAIFGAIGNPIGAVLTMLVALVVVLGGLGLAATIMAPIIPAMALLAAVLLLIGAAVLAAGAGLTMLSTSIVAFSAAVLSNIGTIIAAFLALVAGMGAVLFELGTVVISVVSQLIPQLVNAGLALISALISGFASNAGGIIVGIAILIVNILQGLAAAAGTIIQAGVELAIALINGIADGIRNNSDAIFDALMNILSSVIELIISALGNLLGKIPGIGPKIKQALDGAEASVREFLTGTSFEDAEVDVPVNANVDVQNGDAVKKELAGQMDDFYSSSAEEASAAARKAGSDNMAAYIEGAKEQATNAENKNILGQVFENAGVTLPELGDNVNVTSILDGLSGDSLDALKNSGLDLSSLSGMNGTDMNQYLKGLVGSVGPEDMSEQTAPLVNSMTESIDTQLQEKTADIGNSVTTMFSTAFSDLDLAPVMSQLTVDFTEKFGESLVTNAETDGTVNTKIVEWLTNAIGNSDLSGIGGNAADAVAEGFTTGVSSPANAQASEKSGLELANSAKSGAEQADSSGSGNNFALGFINAIGAHLQEAYDAALKLGAKACEGLSAGIAEGSPSKLTAISGKYFDQGFIIAIDANAMYAAAAAYRMGYGSVESLNEGIQNGDVARVVPVLDVSDLYNQMEAFDGVYRPRIAPTLDMSGVDPAWSNMRAVATVKSTQSPSGAYEQDSAAGGGYAAVNFTQNNYSPKSLSAVEIYRQTKNQLDTVKGLIKKA